MPVQTLCPMTRAELTAAADALGASWDCGHATSDTLTFAGEPSCGPGCLRQAGVHTSFTISTRQSRGDPGLESCHQQPLHASSAAFEFCCGAVAFKSRGPPQPPSNAPQVPGDDTEAPLDRSSVLRALAEGCAAGLQSACPGRPVKVDLQDPQVCVRPGDVCLELMLLHAHTKCLVDVWSGCSA